jgi:hypothetical protein
MYKIISRKPSTACQFDNFYNFMCLFFLSSFFLSRLSSRSHNITKRRSVTHGIVNSLIFNRMLFCSDRFFFFKKSTNSLCVRIRVHSDEIIKVRRQWHAGRLWDLNSLQVSSFGHQC